ncbi:MAG: sensor histidine kinase [Rhodocyclaceae bacterium]|nr:sensor histidine kinase [Rhodocyclaceae bacterium]
MDLRRRLLSTLGILLGVLLLVTVLINLSSLRQDINAEISASAQLVQVLLKAGEIEHDLPPAEAAAHLKAMLHAAPLRHLTLSLDHAPLPAHAETTTSWLAQMLGVETSGETTIQSGQLIHLGEQRLRIAPNPNSEIEERLGDTVRLCITLLLYSGATLLVTWWSADRALAPVRELEAGLQRLADGNNEAALPTFALREFSQVASAIDSLASALASSRSAQRQLARQLIEIQEEERRTLARELHDEMGQTLTAIGVTASFLERNAGQINAEQVAECAHELRRDVRTSGEQLRAMLKGLRPHGLDAGGLVSALHELVAGWQQRESGICFQLTMPAPLPVVSEAAGLVLYRVVQEALTNAVRHSTAGHCRVTIESSSGLLRLTVEDDGKGLPPENIAQSGGLLGMKERVEMLGGTLVISTGQESGLKLQVSLPLQ